MRVFEKDGQKSEKEMIGCVNVFERKTSENVCEYREVGDLE